MDSSSFQNLHVPNVVLGEKLGEGSFGAVFRGRHATLDIDVAVKFVTVDGSEAGVAPTAIGEARLMARLDHPNLVRIYDAGMLPGVLYFVLELMDGGSCLELRRIAAEQAQNFARQLLAGLQALHEARIIHRDIKPANCLLRHSDSRVKLADLGIAVEQATRTDVSYGMAGTLPFMAPELFDTPPRYSARSDLYALGMTLASLTLESDPFPHVALGELIAWARHGRRVRLASMRPDLPTPFADLVDRMCLADPLARPATAAEALAALSERVPLAVAPASADELGLQRIGAWVLGETVYTSSNWKASVVAHAQTGAAGRLFHLQSGGPLSGQSPLILESARRASRIEHPAILDVLDWGTDDGRAWVVTAPWGSTIDHLVTSSGSCDEVTAVEFCASLADALAYLHSKGLVYQILDPGSAVIAADARLAQLSWPAYCVEAGAPSITDAGRAQRVFVPIWAAPEALPGISPTVEPTVDVYGLGQVLYYMLAGQGAHTGGRSDDLWALKQQHAPDLRVAVPSVSGPTAALCAELLDPDPARRPSDAAEVARELRRTARRLRGLRGAPPSVGD